MTKLWLGRRAEWMTCALSVVSASCYIGHNEDSANKPVASDSLDLVGGFSANDPSLNAVGAMVIKDPYWGSSQLCTAVLVSDNMAITAKHCVEVFDDPLGSGTTVVFAIGPDLNSPIREVEVVDYEKAPVRSGGYVGRGHDFGVLHLGERITDIHPMPWGKITDAAVGLKFTGIGYGEQDDNGTSGTRRIGTLTLRARKGRTLEILTGTFEQYFEAVEEEPLPKVCGYSNYDDDAGEPWVVSPLDGGFGGVGGFGGSGGKGGSGGAGGITDEERWLCEDAKELRERYDTQKLEKLTEVVVGGVPGDSQPCYGDSGGPLLRKRLSDDQMTIWGLTSGIIGNRSGTCRNYGSVYAALDTTVTDFLDRAKLWVDPCEGVSAVGRCVGSVAERCTILAEGKRRKLSFDCAAVDLTCEKQTDGSIGCGSDDSHFAPPPNVVMAQPITQETVARKMLGPALPSRK
jgi:hypothetical protein